MKIDKTTLLFYGCKIDPRLRDALHHCKPSDRRYFESETNEFLRVVEHGQAKWIGKVFPGGANGNELEDIQRNVSSILKRVATEVRISPTQYKLFSVEAEGLVVEVNPEDETDEAVNIDAPPP